MVLLREAFDEMNLVEIEIILNKEEAGIKDDEYMMKYINQLLKNIRKKALLQVLRPFKEVSFAYLSNKLNNTGSEVIESLLVWVKHCRL